MYVDIKIELNIDMIMIDAYIPIVPLYPLFIFNAYYALKPSKTGQNFDNKFDIKSMIFAYIPGKRRFA